MRKEFPKDPTWKSSNGPFREAVERHGYATAHPRVLVSFNLNFDLSLLYSVGSGPPAHSFTVRSHDALASFIPSGDRVMPRTAAVWALMVLKQRPFERSQNRIVASSLALMSTLLSDVTASERTHPVCPFSVRCSATWGMSNNLIV